MRWHACCPGALTVDATPVIVVRGNKKNVRTKGKNFILNQLLLQHAVLSQQSDSAVQVICVSHTSKENTVLRACLSPHHVWAIPNGKVRWSSRNDVYQQCSLWPAALPACLPACNTPCWCLLPSRLAMALLFLHQ